MFASTARSLDRLHHLLGGTIGRWSCLATFVRLPSWSAATGFGRWTNEGLGEQDHMPGAGVHGIPL